MHVIYNQQRQPNRFKKCTIQYTIIRTVNILSFLLIKFFDTIIGCRTLKQYKMENLSIPTLRVLYKHYVNWVSAHPERTTDLEASIKWISYFLAGIFIFK